MNKMYAAAALAAAVLLAGCERKPTQPRTGDPDAFAYQSGNEQQGLAGEALAQPLVVRVVDAAGRPASGATVSFATRDTTHGVVTPAQATSDAQGLVQVSWRLGRQPGVDSVTATAGTLKGAPVVFTATAQPNGVISGTVTAAGTVPALGAVRGTSAGAAPPLPVVPLARVGEAASATALVVTFRAERIGAPRVGAPAYRSRATADGVSRDMRARLASVAGLRVRDVSPAVLAARIDVDAGRADQVRAALLRDPAVASVRPEGYGYGAAVQTPNEALWSAQQWHYGMVDLPRAWGITTGSAQVLVAVVDDGTRFDHPDLAPNLTQDGYDFVGYGSTALVCGGGLVEVAGDGNGYDPDPTVPLVYNRTGSCVQPATVGGHGLHVAGTIGAVGNNGTGVAGVSWNVRIRPVRVLNTTNRGTWYDIAQGILYAAGLPASNGAGGTVQAATGARIINLSLGGSEDDPVLRNAVLAAHAAGALLVVSAMNENTSAPFYPAAYPEVISVASVGPLGTRASYSNFGPNVDIAAPGGDLQQSPASIGSYMVGSTSWNFAQGQPTYVYLQGTSMAAPHVSGVAALLLAREPGLTAAQLRARLLDYAVDAGTPGRDDTFGAGILNARNSLTATRSPARAITVALHDAASGARLRSVTAGAGGAFSFGGLADGAYWVVAGEDEDGDGVLGLPDRRWGAFGGAGTPATLQVQGAFVYPVSFAISYPTETEQNGTFETANPLLPGGYYEASLPQANEVDFYRVTLPAGTFAFSTQGRGGGCGHALAADTHLTLYTAAGAVIATNEDADQANRRYCAAVTQAVQAGTYYVGVTGTRSYPGRYAITVRPAS